MKQILFFFFVGVMLFAFTQKMPKTIEINGTIERFGFEPHSYLGIRTAKKIYKIIEAKKYNNLQGKRVKIKAIIIKKAIKPAFPAQIKIIKIQKI